MESLLGLGEHSFIYTLSAWFNKSLQPGVEILARWNVTNCVRGCKRVGKGPSSEETSLTLSPPRDPVLSWSVFDLAKTAYEPGHTEAAISIIEKLQYDVNSEIPSNGLTLFLCACLSGQKRLISYMLSKGANIKRSTKAGDTALYLATFGTLCSQSPDISVLEELIHHGCDVNASNLSGYTALHRAASSGNLQVIKTLIKYGADPYKASASGIYPIDSAINAGHVEAASLLKIYLPNPHAWDIVDPHTPPHIKLGLQSPQKKHLLESTRRVFSPREVTPRVM